MIVTPVGAGHDVRHPISPLGLLSVLTRKLFGFDTPTNEWRDTTTEEGQLTILPPSVHHS